MTDMTLHRVPRGRDVFLEQVRAVALALRPVLLVGAIVLGIITLLMVIDIASGHAATWFDSDDWSPLAFLAFLLPFAVWRREKPFAPAFLWTLPVDRRRLAFAKVFAGWIWLIAALTFFIIWQRTAALISGVTHPRTTSVLAFAGVTATYLFGSALILGLRYPLRWLFGTVGVFVLLAQLNEALGRTASGQSRMFTSTALLRWVIYGPYGIDTFLSSRAFGSAIHDSATLLVFLWLGAGLLALWAAISRHGERRRR